MPESVRNIIVTGGAGFLGSHLCEALLSAGHRVICIDSFITGSELNVNHLLVNPNFEFLKHDMTEPLELEKLPELEKFKVRFQGIQEIYHLACPSSVKLFADQTEEILRANAFGTYHALNWAKRYQAKFELASSSVVYGSRSEKSSGYQAKEGDVGEVDQLSARATYDEGKRFAETMVAEYARKYQLDAKIARIFRTYGPRMKLNDAQMIPDFVLAALEDEPLVIFGNESFSTSLCYVSDMVSGMIKLMAAKSDIGPMNLGSDQDHRIADVAKEIIRLTDSKSEITYQEGLLFLTELVLPDITKAKELLGWLPVVPLATGLEKTIAYLKSQRHVMTPQDLLSRE